MIGSKRGGICIKNCRLHIMNHEKSEDIRSAEEAVALLESAYNELQSKIDAESKDPESDESLYDYDIERVNREAFIQKTWGRIRYEFKKDIILRLAEKAKKNDFFYDILSMIFRYDKSLTRRDFGDTVNVLLTDFEKEDKGSLDRTKINK